MPFFYCGLSGLQLPMRRDEFPVHHQTGSRLAYYSTILNSIEINSSFYRLPQKTTVRKWCQETSPGFRFTFKLWKQVTHNKGLEFLESDVKLFFEAIGNEHEKMGCILLQLPLSCDFQNFNQLDRLLNVIKQCKGGWPVAIEFRNKSWYRQEVYDLLSSYSITIVRHDIPKSSPPFTGIPSPFIYLRFHGPTGNYRGDYTSDFLSEYASYIRNWLEEGKTVYAYFNNTMGAAFGNAVEITKMVQDDK